MLDPQLWPLWCGVVLTLIAAAINWKTLKVPNWLTLGAAGAGFIVGILGTASVVPMRGGFFSALGGCAVAFFLLAAPYVTGRLGAANVKMQMAFGIWVGCAFSAGTAALLVLAGTILGSVFGNIQRAMKKRSMQAKDPKEAAKTAADPKQMMVAVQVPLAIGAVIAVVVPLALGWV